MAGHVHADLIAQYLEDAMVSSQPWKYWQYQLEEGNVWHDAFREIAFFSHHKYRRKPKTISINGFDVPEPVRQELKKEQTYYFPCFRNDSSADWYRWCDDETDYRLLEAGVIHLTQEAAIQHAKALLSFTERKE